MAIRKFSDSLIDPLTDSTMKIHLFFITINVSISIIKAVLLFSSKLHNCYILKNCPTVKKRQNDPSQFKWLDRLDSLNYTGFSWKFPVEGKNWENSNLRAHWNVHFSTCTCTFWITWKTFWIIFYHVFAVTLNETIYYDTLKIRWVHTRPLSALDLYSSSRVLGNHLKCT